MLIVAVLLPVAAGVCAENTVLVEINANSSDVEGRVVGTIFRHQADVKAGGGILYSDDDYLISHLSLSLNDSVFTEALSLGIGFKGVYGRFENDIAPNDDLGAIGFLVCGEYDFNKHPLQWPVTISADVSLAPSPLSFGDTDQYLDANISVCGFVHRNAGVVLGYRYVEAKFDYEPGNAKHADDAIFLGCRLVF